MSRIHSGAGLRLALVGLVVVAVAGCKGDSEKLVGTWEMDCVGMVERLNGSRVPEKISKCERELGITIVLAADGGFSFTSKNRMHHRGSWRLEEGLLVWVDDSDKPTRNRYELDGDELFLKSPATGAILVMKRTGEGVLEPAQGAATMPAGDREPGSQADEIGRKVVEALRSRDIAKLHAIMPAGLSDELATEIKRTREVALGDFDDLIEEMIDDGIDIEIAAFERTELTGSGEYSPLGSAEVFFKCGGKSYYVYVSWSRTGKGPAFIGLSRWYKPAQVD